MKKIALLILCSIGVAQAGVPLPWVKSSSINGFSAAIAGVSQQNKAPVVFPIYIPSTSGVTYAFNFDTMEYTHNGYNLYVDSTPDCKGAQYCNILTLTASTKGKLTVAKNSQGQIMTVAAILNDGVQANYTQGYAKGDYWNPNIMWQANGITYTITWKGIADTDQTRKALISMANNLQAYPSQLQPNS